MADVYCIKILSELVQVGGELTYNELWRRVKLPKKTFNKHLGELCREDFIERENDGLKQRGQKVKYKVKQLRETADWLMNTVNLGGALKLISETDNGRHIMYAMFFLSQMAILSWVLDSITKEQHTGFNTLIALRTIHTVVLGSINKLQTKPRLRTEALQSTAEFIELLFKQVCEGVPDVALAPLERFKQWVKTCVGES